MARRFAAAVGAVLALLVAGGAVMAHGVDDGASAVIELTDASFERLTQATTGATTGDWMIVFYAPWCGHCKNMMPTWEDLARELSGRVNIAKVDVTANSGLGGRFGIRGFPTIYFLRQGSMYKYEGARTLADFSAFALGGYASGTALAIPAEPTLQDLIITTWTDAVQDFNKLIGSGRYGVLVAVLLVGVGIGGIFGIVIGAFVASATAPSTTQTTAAAANRNDAAANNAKTEEEAAAAASSSAYAPSTATATHRKAAKAL